MSPICQWSMLDLQYKENKEVKKSSKERWSKMTTLTKTKEHSPMLSAISEIGDTQYTFCQECENNIERYYYDGDPERLPEWTDWYVTK